jgi:hypothetical protein
MPLTEAEELELLELEAEAEGWDNQPELSPTDKAMQERHKVEDEWRKKTPWYTKLLQGPPTVKSNSFAPALGWAGGMVSTGIDEVLNRVKTKGAEGAGGENWNAARKGGARGMPEVLQERAGMSPTMSMLVGLPIQAVTDPFSSLGMGAMVGKMPKTSVWSAMKQNVGQNIPFANAISSGLEKGAKFSYRQPWRAVEKEMESYADADRYNRWEFADTLMDHGVKGSARKQKAAIEDLRKGAREKYMEATEGYRADMAPEVTQEAAAAGNEHAAKSIARIKKAAAQKAEAQAAAKIDEAKAAGVVFSPEEEAAALEKFTGEYVARNAMSAEDEATLAKEFFEEGEDAFKAQLKSKLNASFAGEANARAKAVQQLRALLPEQFSNEISQLAKKLDGPEREVALKSISDMINTGLSGEKKLADIVDTASEFGMKAAGSDQLSSNVYKTTAKKSTAKASASKTGSNTKDFIREQMSPEDLATFENERRNYGLWARGKKAAVTVLDNSLSRPLLTGTDLGLMATGALSPWALAVPAAKKISDISRYYPQVTSQVGLGLRGMSKTNLWDNILREAILNEAKDGKRED